MSPGKRCLSTIREADGIVDPMTGEICEAEIFVGVLGASNLTYAEATWTQKLPDWTGATCAVPLFRRRAEAAGSRQYEERGQQGLLLRSRDQPDLRGHGGALLGWRPAGAAGKATGQGEGRGRVRFAQTYILGGCAG